MDLYGLIGIKIVFVFFRVCLEFSREIGKKIVLLWDFIFWSIN